MGSTSAALSLSLTPMASPPGNSSAETSTSSRRERSKQESPAHSKAAQMYPRPLQELVSVAREGEVDELQSHVNALQARAIRLTSIAETAANTVRHNPKLMKSAHTHTHTPHTDHLSHCLPPSQSAQDKGIGTEQVDSAGDRPCGGSGKGPSWQPTAGGPATEQPPVGRPRWPAHRGHSESQLPLVQDGRETSVCCQEG